jgi:hypothetical protein
MSDSHAGVCFKKYPVLWREKCKKDNPAWWRDYAFAVGIGYLIRLAPNILGKGLKRARK